MGHLTFEKRKSSGLVTEALCISGDIDRGPHGRHGTKWCCVLTVAALCSCQMRPHVNRLANQRVLMRSVYQRFLLGIRFLVSNQELCPSTKFQIVSFFPESFMVV